ncbi:LysR family transcriptional regulator [Ignatzschineria sp. LJL83]
MSVRLMRIFRSVAEHYSFSKAAEELEITRPAISQAITQLEESLDVKLFNRTTRSVKLTPEGSLYFHHVVDILERIELMEDQLKLPFQGPVGRVRIDTTPAIARGFLLPLITSFQEKYPNIEILLGTHSYHADFNESAIDFMLQVGDISNPSGDGSNQDLVCHVLDDVHFICCASPDYLNAHGTPTTLEELERHTAINHFSISTGRTYPWVFLKNKNLKYIRINHNIAVTDSEMTLAYTLAGKGISVLPYYLAIKYIQTGELIPVLEDFPLATRPLNLLYSKNKVMSQRSKTFIKWLIHRGEEDQKLKEQ